MRNDVYETIEYRGHTIETGFETDDISMFDPRENDGNMGTLDIAIRGYTYGDEQTDPSDMQVECSLCTGDEDHVGEVPVPTTAAREERPYGSFDPGWQSCPVCEGSGERTDPVAWAVEQGATVVLPVYAYIHSGTTFRTSTRLYPPTEEQGGNPFSCSWDSGMAGIIYDTPDGVKAAFGESVYDEESKRYRDTGRYLTDDGLHPSVELVEECLRSEVKTYDDYVTGDIMWYRIEGPSADEGCGGFFPDEKGHGYMEDEARSEIDASIRHAWERGIEELVEQRKIHNIMAL